MTFLEAVLDTPLDAHSNTEAVKELPNRRTCTDFYPPDRTPAPLPAQQGRSWLDRATQSLYRDWQHVAFIVIGLVALAWFLTGVNW